MFCNNNMARLITVVLLSTGVRNVNNFVLFWRKTIIIVMFEVKFRIRNIRDTVI